MIKVLFDFFVNSDVYSIEDFVVFIIKSLKDTQITDKIARIYLSKDKEKMKNYAKYLDNNLPLEKQKKIIIRYMKKYHNNDCVFHLLANELKNLNFNMPNIEGNLKIYFYLNKGRLDGHIEGIDGSLIYPEISTTADNSYLSFIDIVNYLNNL